MEIKSAMCSIVTGHKKENKKYEKSRLKKTCFFHAQNQENIMKQKFKRWMAGLLAVLTVFTSLFTNGTTAFAASASANISFWYASTKDSGEVSELKAGYSHGKVLYAMIDGHSAYCMNFGLAAKGGQLMNSYDNSSTSLTDTQALYLRYCLYYGFSSTSTSAPSNDQCDQYIATQSMVWIIEKGIYGTASADSAAKKLCDTAPNPTASYQYYATLKSNIDEGINAVIPSFAASRKSQAPTYELKWNEPNQRFETTLTDGNGVLSEFDLSLSGYSTSRNGNSLTIYSSEVNTSATTGTFTSNSGKVEVTGSCVFWLTGNSGDQEFVSEVPHGDPLPAYIKVKTENIGYGELYKKDEASGVNLAGAVYGIYSDSSCKNLVQTITTDKNGYAKSGALVAGTYYMKEITAPNKYVVSDKVHTLQVKPGKTTTVNATDKEQLGAITIYKEGEVLTGWNGSNFTYETRKLPGATFKVTAGADIYKADGIKVYNKGDLIAENLVTGNDGKVLLSNLHLGTYVVTETASINGYTINTTPQTVNIEYKDQTVEVQYEATSIYNNRQKAAVSVTKKDDDTENPLDGGKYTLYAGNDIKNYDGSVIVTKGTALQTVTTGEDGNAVFTVDLPIANSYYVSETQAPYGYIRNSEDVYSFNFNNMSETTASASFSHTFVNDHTTAKIHLYKVDKETGKAVPQGDATVIKTDAETGDELEWAVFGLYAAEDVVNADGKVVVAKDALVEKAVTGKDGKCVFTSDLPLGQYYVKEIEAPKGYVLGEDIFELDASYQGDDVKVIKLEAEFENYPTKLEISKTDITEEHELKDATLSIIDKDGNVVETWKSDGKPHVIDRIPVGEYILREETAPYGYKIANEVKFTVENTKELQQVSMKDELVSGKIIIEKTDADTGKGIAGVEFEIRDKDGNVIETLVTDKNGHAESMELPIAVFKDGNYVEDIKYYVVETKAAEGYILDSTPHEVVLQYDDDAPDVVEYTLKLTNKPTEPKLPQTGDNMNPWWFTGVGLVTIVAGIMVFRKRKSKEK